MKAEILFNSGVLKPLEFLKQRFYTIGRLKECDFSFSNDEALSRRHATLFFNDSGRWQITDGDLLLNTQSSGGIFINGEKLDPNHGYELNHNDLIQLSHKTSFRFFLILDNGRPQEGDTLL